MNNKYLLFFQPFGMFFVSKNARLNMASLVFGSFIFFFDLFLVRKHSSDFLDSYMILFIVFITGFFSIKGSSGIKIKEFIMMYFIVSFLCLYGAVVAKGWGAVVNFELLAFFITFFYFFSLKYFVDRFGDV